MLLQNIYHQFYYTHAFDYGAWNLFYYTNSPKFLR